MSGVVRSSRFAAVGRPPFLPSRTLKLPPARRTKLGSRDVMPGMRAWPVSDERLSRDVSVFSRVGWNGSLLMMRDGSRDIGWRGSTFRDVSVGALTFSAEPLRSFTVVVSILSRLGDENALVSIDGGLLLRLICSFKRLFSSSSELNSLVSIE